jgi:fibrillarin-like rRNA methylase
MYKKYTLNFHVQNPIANMYCLFLQVKSLKKSVDSVKNAVRIVENQISKLNSNVFQPQDNSELNIYITLFGMNAFYF